MTKKQLQEANLLSMRLDLIEQNLRQTILNNLDQDKRDMAKEFELI